MDNNHTKPITSLCVTIDYELFGDGSGDIQAHMVRPTDELITFFAAKNIRATFFIEVAELLCFVEALRSGRCAASLMHDYDAIRRQLERLLALGHDIQLHVHPQWIDAGWDGKRWRLSSCHGSLLQWGSEPLTELVRRGRALLEGLGREVNAEYSCRIFRAGGLHFDRTEELGQLLLANGLMMDSSVCRGYCRQTSYSSIDYRDLLGVRVPYWSTLDGGMATNLVQSLIEIPVWAVWKRQWNKVRLTRLRNKLRRDVAELDQQRVMAEADIPRTPWGVCSWLMQRQALLWDFCLMTGRQLIQAFNDAVKFHSVDGFFPLVMLGHTKEVQSLSSLSQLHTYLDQNAPFEWITMSEALNKVNRATA